MLCRSPRYVSSYSSQNFACSVTGKKFLWASFIFFLSIWGQQKLWCKSLFFFSLVVQSEILEAHCGWACFVCGMLLPIDVFSVSNIYSFMVANPQAFVRVVCLVHFPLCSCHSWSSQIPETVWLWNLCHRNRIAFPDCTMSLCTLLHPMLRSRRFHPL